MKKTISTQLEKSMLSLKDSWQWISADFAEEFEELCQNPANFTPEGPGEVIWQTRNKYVLLLTTKSGRKVIYKTTPYIKRSHQYLHRRSPFGNEAWYFQKFAQMGLPMAKLLAAGDVRTNFMLKSGFVITEFAEGFSNGGDFIPGNSLGENFPLRDAYIRKNLEYMAYIHDKRILHRGTTPMNFLYRQNGEVLELVWIDVATSHYKPFFYRMKPGIVMEIANFLRFFQLNAEERKCYIDYYHNCVKRRYYSTAELTRKVDICISEHFNYPV
jgi:serine/threonine protein kinase